jgi:prepilin-type N-terminal cleavage/methylation domain-containing protein
MKLKAFLKNNSGFTLVELAIVTTIITISLSVGLWKMSQDAKIDKGYALADQLKTISGGVSSYITTNYGQLSAAVPVISGVVNPMRPTIAELKAGGYLNSAINITNIYGSGYGVFLNKAPASCIPPACDVEGLVSITQPITHPSSSAIDTVVLGAASKRLGGDSAVSYTAAIFSGAGGTWTMPNPLTKAGLLAIRNGYNASGFAALYRRDGSVPLTGNLAGGGMNIDDVNTINASGTVNAATVAATGNVTAGKMLINDVVVQDTACSPNGLMAMDSTGRLLTCQDGVWKKAVKSPNLYRFMFTSSQSWTVPEGVVSAFVTMAGGGGSGAGWRMSTATHTGHTGGYVFSHPVNFVPNETIQVIVGQGGQHFLPVANALATSPYVYYTAPAGDDGLGGYPGTSSKLLSPTQGTLLECTGGSGAHFYNGVDSYEGSTVAGGLSGAITGSGAPSYSTPNRVASGPYSGTNSPGACGPADYGRGNVGIITHGIGSGYRIGGTTPFGYGSGGGISVSGIYVTPIYTGIGIFPDAPRDGVVFIDVLY